MTDFFFVLILIVAGCMSCFGQDEWCQYGIIDGNGKVLVPFEYDNIKLTSGGGEYGIPGIELYKKSFVGFASADGDILVPCEYDYVMASSEGMACVALDGKFGYVDMSTGKLVIPCTWGHQPTSSDGMWGYASFSDGVVIVTKGKKSICLDKKGKQLFVLGVEYNWCEDFHNGYAVVGKGKVSEGGFCQQAVIDKTGKEVIPCIFDEKTSIKGFNNHGMACFESLDDKFGLINIKGEIVLPCIYDRMYDVGNGKEKDAPIYIKNNGKVGCLDAKGNELIKMEYDDCRARNGFIIVKKNGKYGCFNYKGKEILPCSYNDISFSKNGKRYIVIKANGTKEYLDENGHKIKVSNDNNLKIKNNGKNCYGIENSQGDLIVPCIYRELTPISAGHNEWYGNKPTFIAKKAMR